MKTFAISLVSSVCVIAALAWPQTSRAQAVPLVFQTTFDDINFPDRRPGEHWNQTDGFGDADVGQTGDGISGGGVFTTSLGSVDRIIAAANYPGGGGGKGLRHYRGNAVDGHNDNAGGLTITLPSAHTELWVRVYMRFAAGFHWTFSPDQHPQYTKDLYWHVGGPNFFILGYQSGRGDNPSDPLRRGWGIFNGVNAVGSNWEWSNQYGTDGVSDGSWHCYEWHVNQTTGKVDIWIDNVHRLQNFQFSFPQAGPWSQFILGSNQAEVADSTGKTVNQGGTPTDWYTDYDDIAVSATGRIGCTVQPNKLRIQ